MTTNPRSTSLSSSTLQHELEPLRSEDTVEQAEASQRSRLSQLAHYLGLSATNSSWSKIGTVTLWLLFSFLCVNQVILLSVTIDGVSGSKGVPTGNDFAFYKNTKFHDCQTGPKNQDCARVFHDERIWGHSNPDEWCSAVSCLSNYTIVPSKPRPAAFRESTQVVWFWLNLGAISALWKAHKARLTARHNAELEICGGFDSTDCIFIGIDVFSLGIWWYFFGKLATNPSKAAPVSILNWQIAWLYFPAMNLHPIGCRLSGLSPRYRRAAFGAIVLFVSIQLTATLWSMWIKRSEGWAASLFAFLDALGSTEHYSPLYDCLPGDMASSSGLGNCSTDTICSTNRLFIDPLITDSTLIFVMIYLALLILSVAFVPVLYLVRGLRRRGSVIGTHFWVVFTILILGGLLADCFGLAYLRYGGDLGTARQAYVAFDATCRVAHVAMSPWRQYLDVGIGARALRVVKIWFNG